MEKYVLTPAELALLMKEGHTQAELENADQVISTYEDWLDPDYPIFNFSRGISTNYRLENGDFSPFFKDKGGKLTLYILPENEWLKIEQRKSEVVEAFVKAYLDALIDCFEEKYVTSLKPLLLVEREIEIVTNLVLGKIPIRTSGYVYITYPVSLERLNLFFRNDGGDYQRIDYWYTRMCIMGESPMGAFSRFHTTQTASDLNHHHPETLHFIVAALAFYRFEEYLKRKLTENEPSALDAKTDRPTARPRTFQSLFKGEAEMNRLLVAAASIGLIVKDGEGYVWPDEGNKGHRIRAFWQTAVDAGLTGRVKSKEAIPKTIKEFFGMVSLSKDTIENQNPQNEVYRNTKTALEKKLKEQ